MLSRRRLGASANRPSQHSTSCTSSGSTERSSASMCIQRFPTSWRRCTASWDSQVVLAAWMACTSCGRVALGPRNTSTEERRSNPRWRLTSSAIRPPASNPSLAFFTARSTIRPWCAATREDKVGDDTPRPPASEAEASSPTRTHVLAACQQAAHDDEELILETD